MASKKEVVFLPKIVKGPGRIDLLEALFFDREKSLVFDVDRMVGDRSQVFAKLLGVIPCKMEQAKVLIIEFFLDRSAAERSERTRSVIVYDDHLRKGRFTKSYTVDELLDESWYT